MHINIRASVLAMLALVLSACSLAPVRSLTQEAAAPYQPIDVKVVVRHPELYGAFMTMKISQKNTNPCLVGIEPDAIPEVSIYCGGLTDILSAKFTVKRARNAEEAVRPLRGELSGLDMATLLSQALEPSLRALPNVKIASWSLMKKANAAGVEEAYRASTANAVLFIHLDYHLSPDFSAFEVSTDSLLYARSLSARTAAGFNNSPAPGAADSLPALLPSNAVYRSSVIYHADLAPQAANGLPAYVATWQADGARLVRAAVEDAQVQLPRLLAEEFQRANDAKRPVLRTVEEQGNTAELIADKDGKQSMVMPGGTLYYKTNVLTTLQRRTATAAK